MNRLFYVLVCFVWAGMPALYADKSIVTSASMALMEGVNSLTGERAPICAASSDRKSVNKPFVSVTAEYVSSVEQMYRSVGVNAAAKFGGIGQSARINFGMSSEQFFDRRYDVLAVVESVTTTAQAAFPPFTLPENLRNSRRNNEVTFRQKCGSDFVSEIVTGGRFTVLLRAEKMSLRDENQLRADVHLAFGLSSGDLAFRDASRRLAENSSLQVYMIRTGGEGDVPALTPAAMIKAAQEFPPVVKKNGIVVSVTVTSYSAAGREMTRDLDAENRENVLYQLGANFDRAYDLHRAINAVLNGDPQFSFHNKATEIQALVESSRKTADYIDHVPALAEPCLDRKRKCSLNMVPRLAVVTLPKSLAESGGGCYKWTPDDHYCLDYRMIGGAAPVLDFSAPMSPDRKYSVIAAGTIYPDTRGPENLRNIIL